MKRQKILVLGAGLAGLSVSYFLKNKGCNALIFEKESQPGGLCRSVTKEPFTFDISGHLLHFRSPFAYNLISQTLRLPLKKLTRQAYVYAFNRLIPYPFQLSLRHLPRAIAKECYEEFIKAHQDGKHAGGNGNFLSWSYRTFGSGLTHHFMIPYNTKFWKIKLDRLASHWAQRFIVTPTVADMQNAYRGEFSKNTGYNAYFWYPRSGGIQSLTESFLKNNQPLYLSHEVKSIHIRKHIVTFRNGKREDFDTLISTLPLPELGRIAVDVPPAVRAQFTKLKWLSVFNLNLGLKRRLPHKRHWIYFPQKNITFYRTGFFHNFSHSLAPRDTSSLYVEVSYRPHQMIERAPLTRTITQDLKTAGVIPQAAPVLERQVNTIRYAYPLFDYNYHHARKRIADYLQRRGIYLAGRFGSWQYLSMEDVINESAALADAITS